MDRLEEAGDAIDHHAARQAFRVGLKRIAGQRPAGEDGRPALVDGEIAFQQVEDEPLAVRVVQVEEMPGMIEGEAALGHGARRAADGRPRLEDQARGDAEPAQVVGRREAGQASAQDEHVGLHRISTSAIRRPSQYTTAATKAYKASAPLSG